MDMGMSIASMLNEIYEKKSPSCPSSELFFGDKVGRYMMGTMSNTLILTFAGGSVFLCFRYV